MFHRTCLLLPIAVVSAAADLLTNRPIFEIRNDSFMRDGKPVKIHSGSLHYSRVPPVYWRDRIQRVKALGLNSITTYVPWNFHEENEGKYIFSGWQNVTEFIDIAHAEGMVVILRPGPYICGEWEFGGLPAWLLAKPGIRLRTFERNYIEAVERWWKVLLPRFRERLYSQGGPIIMVQIENEYGSFGDCSKNANDAAYMNRLLDLAVDSLGQDVIYSTIDGGEGKSAAQLEAGSPWKGDPRVFATVDGGLGLNYHDGFERQRMFNAPGNSPKMWAELWVGWFTAWGQDAANKSSGEFWSGVSGMMREEASFSLYMAHGGTNFGFWSGANSDSSGETFLPDITSYDYSAPISEAGDHNIGSDGGDLFVAVQNTMSKYQGTPAKEPVSIPRSAYGRVMLNERAALFDHLAFLASCTSEVPAATVLPSMEELGQHYGFILYRRKAAKRFQSRTFQFSATTLHDRAQVFVDGTEVCSAYRPELPKDVNVPSGSKMDILVENMGRINYGPGMYDHKGLLDLPPLPGTWSAFCLPMNSSTVRQLSFQKQASNLTTQGPTFHRGLMHVVGEPTDTYLDMAGWTKGYVWVNGHALGRYWETMGPQHALYTPAPFLQKGDNEVIVFDLHASFSTSLFLTSVVSPRWCASRSNQYI
jgi:beta-galactosidase GanA